jgi:hypothetical protein
LRRDLKARDWEIKTFDKELGPGNLWFIEATQKSHPILCCGIVLNYIAIQTSGPEEPSLRGE